SLGVRRRTSAQSHVRGERELRCGERALGRARAHAGRAARLRRRGDWSERLFRRRLVDAGRRRDNGSINHVQPAVNGERSEPCTKKREHPGLGGRGAANRKSSLLYPRRHWVWPVFDGGCAGGTVTAGGAVRGAMPVVAGGLASSRAVRVLSPPANTSARMMTMNTAPAIHPHRVGAPILRSISISRSMPILRSKSLGSVMAISHR